MQNLLSTAVKHKSTENTWSVLLALRSMGGGDNSILGTLDVAEESKKFTAIGVLVLIAGCSAGFGMFLFLGDALAAYFSAAQPSITGLPVIGEQLLLSLAWGFAIIWLDRAIILSRRTSSQQAKANAFFWFRIVLSLFIAIIVSEPIKLKIYEQDISNQFKKNQLLALKATLQSQSALHKEINTMLDARATTQQGNDVRQNLSKLMALENCAKTAFEAESVGSTNATENGARTIACAVNNEQMPIRGQSCSNTPTCIDGDFYQIWFEEHKGDFLKASPKWLSCQQSIETKPSYTSGCSSSYGYLKKWAITQKNRLEYLLSDDYRRYRNCSNRVANYQALQAEVDNLNQNTFAHKLFLLPDVALTGFWNSLTFVGLTFLLWMLELGAVFAKFVLPTPLHDQLLNDLGGAKLSVYSTVINKIQLEAERLGKLSSQQVADAILAHTTALQIKESGLRLSARKKTPWLDRTQLMVKLCGYSLLILLIYQSYSDKTTANAQPHLQTLKTSLHFNTFASP